MSNQIFIYSFIAILLIGITGFLVYFIIKTRSKKFSSQNYPAVFGIRTIFFAFLSLFGVFPMIIETISKLLNWDFSINNNYLVICFIFMVIGIMAITWSRYKFRSLEENTEDMSSKKISDKTFNIDNHGEIGSVTQIAAILTIL